jgi:hypothetical protein
VCVCVSELPCIVVEIDALGMTYLKQLRELVEHLPHFMARALVRRLEQCDCIIGLGGRTHVKPRTNLGELLQRVLGNLLLLGQLGHSRNEDRPEVLRLHRVTGKTVHAKVVVDRLLDAVVRLANRLRITVW